MLNMLMEVHRIKASMAVTFPQGVNDMNKFAHLVINEEVIPDRKIRDTQRKVDALNHLLDACRIKNGKELKMSQTMWAHVNSEKPKGLTMILRKLVCEHLGVKSHPITPKRILELYAEYPEDRVIYNVARAITLLG
jgi:hypothetical protein